MRETLLDQQKAALLLLQFDDGVKLDTCASMGPRQLSKYLELLPGETLPRTAASIPAAAPQTGETQQRTMLSDDEVASALKGSGKDHWVEIEDMGLMAAQGAQVPSISLFLADALLAKKSESAKKQFLKYEPSPDDRERALTVVAQGFVAKTVQGGCQSVTRIVLLSDLSGKVVKEAYFAGAIGENWKNGFGATNYCESLKAKFSMEDVKQVQSSAQGGEFYIAVFSGAANTKTYKIKRKHQTKLGLN